MARKRADGPKTQRAANKTTNVVPKGYEELLGQLKERILSAQLRASVAVNREMAVLYWQIGATSSPGRNARDGVPRLSTGWPPTFAVHVLR
jgi:hypothetical protein